MIALEPRLMLDAAGIVAGAEVAVDAAARDQVDMALAAQALGVVSAPAADGTDALGAALGEALAGPSVFQAPSEIVFVDPSVADYQALVAGVSDNALVVMLDPTRDGVEQIAEHLDGRSGIEVLHIVSHGGPGFLSLGSGTLNVESMSADHADALDQLGRTLTPNGDIFIYGCNFAAGASGEAAVARLAQSTGADVAASDDLTGSADLGGDWILEARHGEVEGQLAFSSAATNAFNGVLVPPTVTVNTQTTGDSTPEISGTIDDPNVDLVVVVDGNSYNNDPLGPVEITGTTWRLLNDRISPALVDGTYDVLATATTRNAAMETGMDTSTGELVVDLTPPPLPVVDPITTNDSTPVLTGTFDAAETDQLLFVVEGLAFSTIANSPELTIAGNTWRLDLSAIPPLPEGTYNVTVSASDIYGNFASGIATGVVTVDFTAPSVPPVVPPNVPPPDLFAPPEALLELNPAGSNFRSAGPDAALPDQLFADERLFILDEVARVASSSTLESVLARDSAGFESPEGGLLSTRIFDFPPSQVARAATSADALTLTEILNLPPTAAGAAAIATNADTLTVSTLMLDELLFIELEYRFAHSGDTQVQEYTATLIDGSPLPEWLRLDRRSGQLIGEPPIGAATVELRVSVVLSDGTTTVKEFTVDPATGAIDEGDAGLATPALAQAAPPFAAQLARASGSFDRELARLQRAMGA